MKLVCPHCAKVVEVDQSRAGQTTSCPQCQGPFTVPLTPPAVPGNSGPSDRNVPPPPPLPTAPGPLHATTDWRGDGPDVVPPLPPPPPGSAPGSRSAWMPKMQSVTLPAGLGQAWPLVVLVVLFFLQFFPWVGLYVGASTLVRQSGAGIAFGSATIATEMPASLVAQDISSAPLMVLYFLVILAGLIVAIAVVLERFTSSGSLAQLRPTLRQITDRQDRIVTVILVLTAFILLLYVVILSFPLEQAVQGEKAVAVMQEGLKLKLSGDWQVKAADMVPMQWLQRRCWFAVAFLINLIAALIVGYRWLQSRGITSRWPRLIVQWPSSPSSVAAPAESESKPDWGPKVG